jgi:GxxExxY protein
MPHDELDAVSRLVLKCAYSVHTALGPGLLESSYTACLRYELEKSGAEVRSEVPVPLAYDSHKLLDVGYRIDLLVQGEVIVEVKAVDAVSPVHLAQLLSYLRFSGKRVGLLLNFNVIHLKEGIYRRVNKF